ncbi:LamG domain-containing protein [Candidatus Hydrogenedentota bacterium]
MAAGDLYHISGGLKGRHAVATLAGDHNDYIQVNAHAVARVAANDTVGTYTAWINLANVTDTSAILCAGDDNVVEFLEFSVEAGLLTVRCTDATVAQFVTQADAVGFVPHTWYHVAVVQRADGSGVHLYIDGQPIASTNDTATDVDEWYTNLDGIDTFRIGAANKAGDASVTDDYHGAISKVQYWNLALTDAEVEQDYLGEAVQAANLQLSMDMVNDLVDAGLGADNGTAVGAILQMSNYSEFTSRLRNDLAAAPVVADDISITASDGNGHAIIVKAA